jgi:heparosan-N-sulfate-glucuronate 5-epimerase
MPVYPCQTARFCANLSTIPPLTRRKSFSLPPGRHVGDPVRGYYVDFTEKADEPSWPPDWFPWPGYHRFMAVPQWGLGAYERYLDGDGDQWLAAAMEAGRYLVAEQVREGALSGGWFEPLDYPHTFDVRGPWLSAMAQGQCSSLLVRLHRETGDDSLAEAARAGLGPMLMPTSAGGVESNLEGDPFPEEYPTEPAAHVLNGAIFSLWGFYDVWKGLDDDRAGEAFRIGTAALAKHLHRWDTGYWSLYDLFPHPVLNVASPAYHVLHVTQLSALSTQAQHAEIDRVLARFREYSSSPVKRARARARKVFFRIVIPRNRFLARRLPWTAGGR